jgi:hypothetical protein
LLQFIRIYTFSEQYLENALKTRNVEFDILEEKLKQFEEKVNHFILFILHIKKRKFISLDTHIRTITSIASTDFRKNNTRLSNRK